MKQIINNIPDSKGYNAFKRDKSFEKLMNFYCGKNLFQRIKPQFTKLGELVGDKIENLTLSADKSPPELIKRSRTGVNYDKIEKHPDFQALEKIAFSEFGLAAISHRNKIFGFEEKLPPIIKYGLTFLFVQSEFGLCCPISMTDSLTRTLSKFGNKDLVNLFFDKLTSLDMDQLYQGAMFMTEQEAGSDVGNTKTYAENINGNWYLTGEKWFCSNPDADLAMVLARPKGNEKGTKGLSLFLLPKLIDNKTPNDYEILRLKDKLGGRSFASGEIRLNKAFAYLVGDQNQGFKQMTDMINMSRLSNGVRSSGMMQRSLQECLYISKNRKAFNTKLINLPLMQKQILKIFLLAESSRSMVLHSAKVLEKADDGVDIYKILFRILTPLIKFRSCRDARKVTGDLMEVRGGCGYIEEWSDARMVRDAHLGSIWEGTSNIVALDVIRSLKKNDNLKVFKKYLFDIVGNFDIAKDRKYFNDNIEKVFNFALTIINDNIEHSARQISSALYYLSASIFSYNEGHLEPELSYRKKLAKLILKHKICINDPLQKEDLEKSIKSFPNLFSH